MASTPPTTLKRLRLERENRVERFALGSQLPEPATPSLWFSNLYPEQAERYGCPFLEEMVSGMGGIEMVRPIHANDGFFASILSDSELGHSVVFFEPEQRWYYLEPRDQTYHPTTEAKLIALLSALFVRCAEQMPKTVDVECLFVQFREDECLKSIVKKARSVLAADSTFFAPDSPHRRKDGPERTVQLARQFVLSSVRPQAGRLLSMKECHANFTDYCNNQGVEGLERRFFKQMIVEIIREEFGLGLRKDLRDAEGRYSKGWKGFEQPDNAIGQDAEGRYSKGWKGLTVEQAVRN